MRFCPGASPTGNFFLQAAHPVTHGAPSGVWTVLAGIGDRHQFPAVRTDIVHMLHGGSSM